MVFTRHHFIPTDGVGQAIPTGHTGTTRITCMEWDTPIIIMVTVRTGPVTGMVTGTATLAALIMEDGIKTATIKTHTITGQEPDLQEIPEAAAPPEQAGPLLLAKNMKKPLQQKTPTVILGRPDVNQDRLQVVNPPPEQELMLLPEAGQQER